MSYDLYAVHAAPGASATEVARAALDAVEAELPESAPTEETESRKRAVVDALRQRNAALELFAFDFAALARDLGITEAQARTQFRHFELNTPDGGNGIQITVGDTCVSVTVPYWHRDAAARRALDDIADYAEVLQRVGGYVVYDPQLDRLLDTTRDRAAMLACYTSALDAMQASIDAPPKRPWWKLW